MRLCILSKVAAYVNGKVTVCGGVVKRSGLSPVTSDTCYEYTNGSWSLAPFKLNEKRDGAVGVVLKNGTWLIMGGHPGVSSTSGTTCTITNPGIDGIFQSQDLENL